MNPNDMTIFEIANVIFHLKNEGTIQIKIGDKEYSYRDIKNISAEYGLISITIQDVP